MKVPPIQRLLNDLYSAPSAMLEATLRDLAAVLRDQLLAKGEPITGEEMRARFGDGGGSPETRGSVAVIPVRGCITHRRDYWGTSCEGIGAMIDVVAADPNVPTIVYDFDTPGGTVVGLQELAAKMFNLRGVKKQIAQVNGMAASAGYYLAAQCDEIVCLPTGQAGSIGVLWPPHFDISGSLELEGVKVTLISAGKYKTEWNPFEAPSDEAKAIKKAQAEMFYSQFLKDVARGRGVSASDVRSGYGEGRMLFAKDAKAAGLIDRIATMDETLARLVGKKSTGGMRAELDANEPHAFVAGVDGNCTCLRSYLDAIHRPAGVSAEVDPATATQLLEEEFQRRWLR